MPPGPLHRRPPQDAQLASPDLLAPEVAALERVRGELLAADWEVSWVGVGMGGLQQAQGLAWCGDAAGGSAWRCLRVGRAQRARCEVSCPMPRPVPLGRISRIPSGGSEARQAPTPPPPLPTARRPRRPARPAATPAAAAASAGAAAAPAAAAGAAGRWWEGWRQWTSWTATCASCCTTRCPAWVRWVGCTACQPFWAQAE